MRDEKPDQSVNALTLERISRRLGQDRGVFDVSLKVAQGEILAIIGQTGAGKSTLLRMVAGLEKVDSGQLMILGQQADGIKPNQRNISMIFQKDVFYPGQALLADWQRAESLGHFQQWAAVGIGPELILEQLQLEKAFLNQRPETYSGGQARRASLLRAILQNRDMILADEPLNGLDLATRDRVSRLLWRFVKATGKSLVIVAHEPTDSLGIADRIAVLHHGMLLQHGPVETILDRPNHLEIIRLLHFPPWNEVTRAGQNRRFVPPRACRVEPFAEQLSQDTILVDFLRFRWASESIYAEWQDTKTQVFYWTPPPPEFTPNGLLKWRREDEVLFDATTGCAIG